MDKPPRETARPVVRRSQSWRDEERRVSGETATIKALLARFGLHPQKGFGQNFLRDNRYLSRIADAADLSAADLVIEVGPGLGVLTRELASRAGRVVAVEIDRGMAAALQALLGEAPAERQNVEVVNADILQTDPAELLAGQPYKVVANLPYYISSSALRHFLEARVKPSLMITMVQREVAERIMAPPGRLNLLAISVRLYGTPRIVTLVPSQAFYPPPKVDSAVLRIDVLPRPALDVDPDKFFKVVSAGFSARRKQIHNALAQRLWLPADSTTAVLEEAGIDPKCRAETLRMEEWGSLVWALERREVL